MAWMVVVSVWGKEASALADLQALGLDCYQPKFRERVLLRGKRIWIEKRLFGRYFFVRFTEIWSSVYQGRHIASVLIGNVEAPNLVRDEVIENIRSREDHGFVDVHQDRFKLQQSVRIVQGLLSGYRGMYCGNVKGGEAVLVDFFGGKRRVVFSPSSVEAA